MDYKIVRANESIGQIEVAYTDNNILVGVYAIDVPVENGAFIVGQALENLIQAQAPIWLTQRQSDVASATNFDQIKALVQELPPPDPQAKANADMWAQVQFEKQVAKALVKFGVLASDPTEIEVTQL